MRTFDVCVIGSGPAGFAAAMRSFDLGKSVCLIERAALGGIGLHDGALSSKTLWELSRDYRKAIRRDRGFVAQGLTVSWQGVTRVVDEAVSEKRIQLERQLECLAATQPLVHGDHRSITLLRGEASFLDPHHVQVIDRGFAATQIAASFFVIATGSHPRKLPELPIDGQRILTSDHISQLKEFPRSLVILGAGVVGCEFATIFANFGQTEVYVIDRAPRILPFVDEDIAAVCAANLRSLGVTIHQGARLVAMTPGAQEVAYELQYADERCERHVAEKALISIGRAPNTASLHLERAGVKCDERGRVAVDDTQSNVAHIFAVGDVSDDIALVNVAEIEGRHAAERIANVSKKRLSYENLSTIMFLDPEIASIGLDESKACAKKIDYRVVTYRFSLLNRAVAMRATRGFVKLLVTDDDDLRILGMHALGIHASTMLEAVSLLIHQGTSARILAELLHPHPAVTEALQECARILLGSSIYKAQAFPGEITYQIVRFSEGGETRLPGAAT